MKLTNKLMMTGFALALLLSGCKSDDMPAPGAGSDYKELRFIIEMAREGSGTRADGDPNGFDNEHQWSGDYDSEQGDDFDNRINDLRPRLYTVVDGKLGTTVGSISQAEWTKVTGSDTKYEVTCRLDLSGETTYKTVADLEGKDFRFVVVANSTQTGFATGSALGSAYFTRHGIPSEYNPKLKAMATFDGIPMYGVADVHFKDISGKDAWDKHTLTNKDNEEVTIPMLRAMAKIRVNIKDTDDKGSPTEFAGRKVKLVSLHLSRHNHTGYIVPKRWNEVGSVTELDLAKCMNVCTTGSFDNECDPIIPDDDDPNNDKMIRFYCPETYNGRSDVDDGFEAGEYDGETEKDIYLEVKYTADDNDSEVYTNYIYLRPYYTTGDKKGTPNFSVAGWDIIRNHIYEFNITGIAANGSITCEVSQKKWGYQRIETELY